MDFILRLKKVYQCGIIGLQILILDFGRLKSCKIILKVYWLMNLLWLRVVFKLLKLYCRYVIEYKRSLFLRLRYGIMFVIFVYWLLDDDSFVCKYKMDGYVFGNNVECVFFFVLQGVSKGVVVEKLFLMMERDYGILLEMVFCVGDDWLDEDMFESIELFMSEVFFVEVFVCIVG